MIFLKGIRFCLTQWKSQKCEFSDSIRYARKIYIFKTKSKRIWLHLIFFLKCPIYQFKIIPKHNLVLKTNRNEKKSLLNNWEKKRCPKTIFTYSFLLYWWIFSTQLQIYGFHFRKHIFLTVFHIANAFILYITEKHLENIHKINFESRFVFN